MKVAYIFTSNMAHRILSTMILPQMEEGRHGAEVVGMFFFEDNTFLLQKGIAVAERIKHQVISRRVVHAGAGRSGGRAAQETEHEPEMALVACEQSAYEREIAHNLIEGAELGCFPEFYDRMRETGVDQIITL